MAQKIKGAWHKGAGPAVQRFHHAPAKINETETRVNEAKAAERFMQLRAQVNADLIRLEDGENTESIQSNVRTSTSGLHISGNSTVGSSNTIKESRAQLIGNAPPAPSKSAAGSNNK